MTDVLVVAEHRDGRLADVTAELVTAGAAIGSVTVAVIAGDLGPLVAPLSLQGISDIVCVEVDADEFESDVYEQVVSDLVRMRRPDVVLTGFTVDAINYAPALAASLGLGFASDVFALGMDSGALVARRSVYGGKLEAELDFPGCDTVVLMLRAGSYPAAKPAATPLVTSLDIRVDTSRARHRRFVEPDAAADLDITGAEFVLAIGRGVGDAESVQIFDDLARKIGATLAASRPLVDAGWLPASRQVGQSGHVVAPRVYLAFGISGAIQHLAGMRTSDTIIAVNTDADAAIFSVAHFRAVADMFEVATALDRIA